jgi:hypothetical protein
MLSLSTIRSKMITEEFLKSLNAWEIFAEGISDYCGKRIKWVAVRGRGYWDWAIYYSPTLRDSRAIAEHGDKIYSPEHFVVFDESAKKLYRR